MDVRAAFNAIVGNLEYPMFIVTARAGDERLGCLVGFATQTSIDPPRFAVCLSHRNRTYRHGHNADMLGVHCVPADASALAELFGGETGDEDDKFARCDWHDGPEGVPILDACVNWFVGRVLIASPPATTTCSCSSPWRPSAGEQDEFTFHRAKRIAPGHEA